METIRLEVNVSSIRKVVSDSSNATDQVRTRTQVSNFSQLFDGVELLGQGIGLGVRGIDAANNFNLVFGRANLDFNLLFTTFGLNESTSDLERSGGTSLNNLFVVFNGATVDDNLDRLLT